MNIILGKTSVLSFFYNFLREIAILLHMELMKGAFMKMTDIIITLLAVYAVWSAYHIFLLRAVLRSITHVLEEFLDQEA